MKPSDIHLSGRVQLTAWSVRSSLANLPPVPIGTLGIVSKAPWPGCGLARVCFDGHRGELHVLAEDIEPGQDDEIEEYPEYA